MIREDLQIDGLAYLSLALLDGSCDRRVVGLCVLTLYGSTGIIDFLNCAAGDVCHFEDCTRISSFSASGECGDPNAPATTTPRTGKMTHAGSFFFGFFSSS